MYKVEEFPRLHQASLDKKTVLLRVDFNVPLKDGKVTDDERIVRALPTIRYLLEHGARIVAFSHLGRPRGEWRTDLSMKPVADRLADLLEYPVHFVPACIGPDVNSAVEHLGYGEILILENVRFYPGEKANDTEFARALASLGNVYVSDAFGVLHRKHASVYALPALMQERYIGFLVEEEIRNLGALLENPDRPFIALLGGAKVKDKIPVLENLIGKVDTICIGGGMAYTFLYALGHDIGRSRLEKEHIDVVKNLLDLSHRYGTEFLLPVDHIAVDHIDVDATITRIRTGEDFHGKIGVDIGPETRKLFAQKIAEARTIFWNGPMGIFEMEPFAEGTRAVARALSEAECFSVVGGGDSLSALKQFGGYEKVTHASTGGGASLTFVAGQHLPGLDVFLEPLKKE